MLHTSAETKPSSFPRTGLRSIALAGVTSNDVIEVFFGFFSG